MITHMQILQLHYIYIAKYRDIVSVRILRRIRTDTISLYFSGSGPKISMATRCNGLDTELSNCNGALTTNGVFLEQHFAQLAHHN